MRGPVGPNHAVDAELAVMRGIPKVPTVGPGLDEPAVGRGELVHEALVDPVPDETALGVRLVRKLRRMFKSERGSAIMLFRNQTTRR